MKAAALVAAVMPVPGQDALVTEFETLALDHCFAAISVGEPARPPRDFEAFTTDELRGDERDLAWSREIPTADGGTGDDAHGDLLFTDEATRLSGGAAFATCSVMLDFRVGDGWPGALSPQDRTALTGRIADWFGAWADTRLAGGWERLGNCYGMDAMDYRGVIGPAAGTAGDALSAHLLSDDRTALFWIERAPKAAIRACLPAEGAEAQ